MTDGDMTEKRAQKGQRVLTDLIGGRGREWECSSPTQEAQVFECLVLSWWNCLGRIRRCGLVEVCHWEWALRSQRSILFPVNSLCLMFVDLFVTLNAMLLVCCHAGMDFNPLQSWAPVG